MKIAFLQDEYWYGTAVKYGRKMPLHKDSSIVLDFRKNQTPNQIMPMLVSTKGRTLWKDTGFRLEIKDGIMTVDDGCILEETGGGLREAYLSLEKKHFPFEGRMPAKELMEKIIYNSWIELTYYQNEKDILTYAASITEHGMPEGVLMIDDGWSETYGDWRFHSGKFPHAKEMIQKLHAMGYEVMLWVCPYVSPDSLSYREAVKEDILVKTPEGEPFIAKWWNGYSAVLDMTSPKAVSWLGAQLDRLMELGIDGFKFDAGDSQYYREDNVSYGNVTPDGQSRAWAEFGEKYKFNEYRVTFGMGGHGLLQRLCDKEHSWGEHGVASLIPDTLLQGITGHPFGCPDMIGGGEYLNFQDMTESGLDEELFVRHSEIACLMPAMQFSAAPYRVLSKENFAAVLKSIEVRKQYLPYIMDELEKAAQTGEPLVRYMSYEFPEERVEKILDQFMLGSRYLAAPVYTKGVTGRDVYLPKGNWIYKGETISSKGETMFLESEYGVPIVLERAAS